MRHKSLTALVFIGFLFALCIMQWSTPSGEAQRNAPVNPKQGQGKKKKLPNGPIGPADPPIALTTSNCCGKKPPLTQIPNYSSSTYATFTGQIAVTTMRPDNASGSSLVIWDLTNQNTAPVGVPWNGVVNPPTNFYYHPDWTRGKIGDVFGLTLDNNGNIYVATTRVHGTTFMGSATVLPGAPGRGDIYKLDANTGAASRFVQSINNTTYQTSAPNKIPNTGPGIGNIHYSCDYDMLYVSSFEDGMIYRIDANGNILSRWDHGHNLPTATPAAPMLDDTDVIANNPGAPFTQLGRRPWAVQVHNGRLYYSIWGEHGGGSGGVPNDPPNEVWSIALTATGDFTGSAKREILMGPLNAPTWDFSNPTADISFSSTGTMLLAERTMGSDIASGTNFSRLLEYQWNGSSWAQPVPNKYGVGAYGGFGAAAGGCDYDQGPGGRAWVTGNGLGKTIPISGLQGLPANGGTFSTSILIDVDNNIILGDKQRAGEVEIPCWSAPNPCVNPPNTTMVAWYPFDETIGSSAANLATMNTGTLINSPTHIPGKVAAALRFDGVNDYVNSPSSIVTNIGPAGIPQTCSGSYSTCRGDFSIDAWIRVHPAASMSAIPIIDKRITVGSKFKGYGFFVFQRNKLMLTIADGGPGPGFTNYFSPIITGLTAGWHHVAVTVSRRSSPAGIKWYYNGAVIGAGNPTAPATTVRYGSLSNNAPLHIGGTSFLNAWFRGDIDELEIFNRELTPAEVQGIFNADTSGKCK